MPLPSRELTVTVVHGDVVKVPEQHPGVDRVFINVDRAACLNCNQDMGLDGTPPSVGAGPESESSTTLALQNRWFVERGTAASSPAFQASSASKPRFFHQVAFSFVLSHQLHL
jgi:hypothetical protein